MLVGKGGSARFEVLQFRQDGGSYLLARRRDFIEVAAETLLDQPKPVGFDSDAVLLGIRHARPFRTRARDACATGGNPSVM